MRLLMTLVVRDEEELLAANLDYHVAQGVDFVLVTDHESSDATPEILADYERRGLVRVFRETGEALEQGPWVTRMARLAASEYGADWVLNNDADEFWWPLAGTLKDMLAAVPERYGQLPVSRHNFVPRPGDGPFWERMVVREASSHNLLGEELEPNSIHRGRDDVEVDHGNHWVSGPAMELAPRLPLIEVLHFPMRTYEQFERKVRQQGRGYGALVDRPPQVGRDQLTVYEIQRRGELGEWFDDAMADDERLARGLADGELIVDRRLADFMSHLSRDGAPPHPDAGALLAVQRLAGHAFAEGPAAASTEARLRETTERLAAQEAELDAARDGLRALQELRESRLLRWTEAPRRAWHRLRGAR